MSQLFRSRCVAGAVGVGLAAGMLALGQQPGPSPTAAPLRARPITTAPGKVGDLLRQWWQAGTAAGNAGDYYDNRDGDHSPLNLAPWPQMSAIKYSPEDVKLFKHWAAQRVLLPHVTFGNSSTSAPPTTGGSNPRMYYTSPAGVQFLYSQYTRNNLYIYPEHRDHDPGHNGKNDGFGDLYPTNTPYLLISQGSSGSDQPFMRMMPFVLASFRPEVKKKLVETGLLMPTIQMLFRSTYKHLKDPKEYVTGKAHPTVFEGSGVDDLAMVQKAHALELKALPPMVQLRVVEEDKAKNGLDFFDLAGTEVVADTPCCIARIHRSKALRRRLVVSAAASFDVNKSPLTYTWVVLRGDPNKISIVPKKDDRSVVELTVAYHERMPVAPGSPLESNRVDIGVFVHNGAYYSAPGFVTFCTLDREARTYDAEGKILEIAHGMGETDLRVTNWDKLLPFVVNDRLAAQLLDIDANRKAAFVKLAAKHQERRALADLAQVEVKAFERQLQALKEPTERAKKNVADARQRAAKLADEVKSFLNDKVAALDDSPRHYVEARLAKMAADPLFLRRQQNWLKERRTAANEPRVQAQWQRLVRWGIAQPDETLTPLRPGKSPAEAQWTRFDRAQLEALHAWLIAELAFPGMLRSSYQVNFIDQRLSALREWRDVYRYDAKGTCIGWVRYGGDGKQEFNHEGLLVIAKDALGRCIKGCVVTYARDPFAGKAFNPHPLRAVLGTTIVRYAYAGASDSIGRRAGEEPATDAKK